MAHNVSFGWQATPRLSTVAHSAKVDTRAHSLIGAPRRRQVVEKWRRYGGSIESNSVVRDPFRKEQLLQPLLVVERRLYPQV